MASEDVVVSKFDILRMHAKKSNGYFYFIQTQRGAARRQLQM